MHRCVAHWAAHSCGASAAPTASLQVEKKVFENVALFKRETESGKGEAGGLRCGGVGRLHTWGRALCFTERCTPRHALAAECTCRAGFTHAAPALCSSSRSLPAAKKEGDQLFDCLACRSTCSSLLKPSDRVSLPACSQEGGRPAVRVL